MPDYLLKRGESEKMIAKWRCGNEKEMDSERQRRRKNAVYAEWKKNV